MGLGSPARGVSLAKARERAREMRELLGDGKDPIAVKREALAIPTFGALADDIITSRGSELRHDKSLAAGSARAAPKLTEDGERVGRKLPEASAKVEAERIAALKVLRETTVDAVTAEQVLRYLRPIWSAKPETASKVRGYVEAVLDAAKAKGHRKAENPARWRGLDHLLPKRQKLSRGHHAALPYAEVPPSSASCASEEALAALALEITVLTAARTGEILGATWDEIDLAENVWIVPAGGMKAGRAHRVPLSARAIEILGEATKLKRDDGFVWPGPKDGRPLSNMAMAVLLNKRMDRPDVTVHEFRSGFRDWAGNATSFPRELAEAALARAVGDETERAYRRGDALEKRRKLMDAWAAYCEPKVAGSNVRPLTSTGSGRRE